MTEISHQQLSKLVLFQRLLHIVKVILYMYAIAKFMPLIKIGVKMRFGNLDHSKYTIAVGGNAPRSLPTIDQSTKTARHRFDGAYLLCMKVYIIYTEIAFFYKYTVYTSQDTTKFHKKVGTGSVTVSIW